MKIHHFPKYWGRANSTSSPYPNQNIERVYLTRPSSEALYNHSGKVLEDWMFWKLNISLLIKCCLFSSITFCVVIRNGRSSVFFYKKWKIFGVLVEVEHLRTVFL